MCKKYLPALPSMGASLQNSLKQQPNCTGTWRLQRIPITPHFNPYYLYPLTPSRMIFIVSTGKLVSFLTRRNGRSSPKLCGSRDRASWEAVCVYCDKWMFLDTWGRSMIGSDDGKWWEVTVASVIYKRMFCENTTFLDTCEYYKVFICSNTST